MPCSTCGAATQVTDSSGGTTEGSFCEIWECANGHTGTITGDAEQSARSWNKSGAVFNEF